MATAGVKVLVLGKKFDLPTDYQVKHSERLTGAMVLVAEFQPDVIVTSGAIPGPLQKASFEVRKRWINVPPDSTPAAISAAIESCYTFNLWNRHQAQDANPLISVYTPTYNTGDYLREAYQSLVEQTYTNWEWVVVDDHSTDGTWERLETMAKEDVRVRPFRSGKPIGKIGGVKGMATRLCRGEYYVEFDHDDWLTDFALDEIKKAFESDPEIGFVYSNSCNFFEDGTFQRFGDEFWSRPERYRETEYRGKKYLECRNPNILDRFGPAHFQQFAFFLTVNANHVRAFRAKAFWELGGYNENLRIADDWDLISRFFLAGPPEELKK